MIGAAAATVLAAAAGGLSAILVALINTWFGRQGRRADITDRITKASETIFIRMEADKTELTARCSKCESELRRLYRVLRNLLLAQDRGDETAAAAAKVEAWALINGDD